MKRTSIFLVVLTLLTGACGSGDETADPQGTTPAAAEDDVAVDGEETNEVTPDLDDAAVVFVWSETGGCAQAGPNCARYEVTAAGEVSTYREGEDVAEVTGTVDVATVETWLNLVGDTDVAALTERLGPGELTAAFDGVDFVLEAPHADLRLSSVDVEFDRGEALFQTAAQLSRLAAEAAPLELKMR